MNLHAVNSLEQKFQDKDQILLQIKEDKTEKEIMVDLTDKLLVEVIIQDMNFHRMGTQPHQDPITMIEIPE